MNSLDNILYLLISLVTLTKITIILTVTKHDLIDASFIGYSIIQYTNAKLFSVLLIFIILTLSIIVQFMSKKHRKIILLSLLFSLLSMMMYNVNTLLII